MKAAHNQKMCRRDMEKLADMWGRGASADEIAAALGRSVGAIYKARHRMGLPTRHVQCDWAVIQSRRAEKRAQILAERAAEEALARREASISRTAGYACLAPQLGIIAYRDRSGVSLSYGIRIAGQIQPPA